MVLKRQLLHQNNGFQGLDNDIATTIIMTTFLLSYKDSHHNHKPQPQFKTIVYRYAEMEVKI